MKCDMHVHSYFSGPCTTPVISMICRESYSAPEMVYERLSQSGMNLFTLTDHDSIEGAESLMRHPDFFMSEEVTCRMPSGAIAHIGVFDITEIQHLQIQQRREDLAALLAYLTERRIFFSINHVFSGLTGTRTQEDFLWFEKYFPAVEACNSQLLETQNAAADRFARRSAKIRIGGSDAHALPSVGAAFTEVPAARNKEEFFSGLRAQMGRAVGRSGGFRRLTRDVLLIALEMMREQRWTALLAPAAALIPVVTVLHFQREREFVRHWSKEILGEPQAGNRPYWMRALQPEAEESTWP
jgi:predicted metal-dependent phosphoesterase TrpH